MALTIGSALVGLYQDQYDSVNATPPPQAPDGAITPEYQPLRGTVAGDPSSFVAHGIGFDSMGAAPGAGRSTGIANQDLEGLGASIANPARARDGFGLMGAGTPELAINNPKRGAILDSRGIVHLGIGPGIPIALLLIALGALYLLTQRGTAA